MFNWICPECGRDVPPSATECRFCAERKQAAGTASATVETAVPVGAPPPQPVPQPVAPQPVYPQQYAPPQPQYAPPQQPYYPPPPQQPQYAPPQAAQPYYPQPSYVPPHEAKTPLPTWAMAIMFGLGFIVLIGLIFFVYQHSGKSAADSAGGAKAAAVAGNKTANPLQKYIEVVGIRLVDDVKHRPEARFIVVNHSNAELNDLTANVTLWASTGGTKGSDEDPVGTFSFKIDSIGGNESKEITAPLNTKLKIYELPDWQNATAEVQLTTP